MKNYAKGCLVPAVTIMLLIVLFCSCTRNGYGCKGNSNIMTRVR